LNFMAKWEGMTLGCSISLFEGSGCKKLMKEVLTGEL
jgi:hypothetical protein